jgi:hypothetical protein
MTSGEQDANGWGSLDNVTASLRNNSNLEYWIILQLKVTTLNSTQAILNVKCNWHTFVSYTFFFFQLGKDPSYLTFKPVTLVPYDNNLINPYIMSKKQVRTYF